MHGVHSIYILGKMDGKKRYGLVAVDFEDNLKRKPKKSYYWYKEMIQNNGKTIKREKY